MEVNFKASPKQSEAWHKLMDDHTTEIGYGGAAYGGKTYLGCYWLTIQALSKPKTRWLIGRESLKNLKPYDIFLSNINILRTSNFVG